MASLDLDKISNRITQNVIGKIEEILGVTPERIGEFCRADKEGRLIVLPCSDDVTVVRNGKTYKGDHWNMPMLTAFCPADTPNGEKVGLFSIEEVEAALAEEGEVKK